MYRSIIRAAGMTNWRELAISVSYCPLCKGKRVFVKLDANEISVRCIFCKATSVTLSLVAVLQRISPDLNSKKVYELSSRGPLVDYLQRASKSLNCSEYFDDITPGSYKNNVQCQDVQNLTYPNESFDLSTSTEVFEHVPNDERAFSEIYRVLKPNGIFVFTVPIDIENKTFERATLISGGKIKHLAAPEYHGDTIRNNEPILAFRNYGYDILERLVNAGFKRAELHIPGFGMPWGYSRPVIIAYRTKDSGSWLNSDPLILRYAS